MGTSSIPNVATPVLVVKVGRYTIHHGSVGVVRSLGRLGVPVFGVVEDRFTPLARSRYLTGAFVWDTHRLGVGQLMDGMTAIAEHLGRPAVLVPTDDFAAIFISEQARALARWFLFPRPPETLPRIVADKKQLYFLCERLCVPAPRSVFPGSLSDVQEFIAQATFPVVVKIARSWQLPVQMAATSIVRTAEHLIALYQQVIDQPNSDLVFQEYIPPQHAEDWFFHGYFNAQSECLVSFTGRKLRSYPPFAGPTTLGQSEGNDALQRQAEALLRDISYSGIVDLDYRFDRRDNQYKLVDFNPRVGAQFRLFQEESGTDVVRALYFDLTLSRIPRSRPVARRTFIAEPYDFVAAISYFWAGELTFREWWRSFRGEKEFAWFSRDDLVPLFIMVVRLLPRALMKMLGIRWHFRGAGRLPCYVRGRGSIESRSVNPPHMKRAERSWRDRGGGTFFQ
jgi:D-aspartate ligase